MVEDNNIRTADIAALETLLAVYGADRTRWPAPDRLRVAHLIATDREAARLVREAEALERLLDMAPSAQVAQNDVIERIMVAARSEVPAHSIRGWSGSVVPGFARLRSRAGSRAGSAAHRVVSGPLEAGWSAMALLAASLLIGAFGGMAGYFDTAFEPLAVAVQGDSFSEPDPGLIAFGGDESGLFEEDLL